MRLTTIRNVGDCFCTDTPWRRTSSGRRACAWATRFCTRTVASSALVPGRNVTVICSTPSESATDLKYIMPSTPLIASSRGADTVSAMTLGLAPGYTVRTTTDGGTTLGYSSVGRIGIAIRPAAKITIDRTAAKIGRSMKNFEKSIAPVSSVIRDVGCDRLHRYGFRINRKARHIHFIHAVDDHLVARGEAAFNDAQPVGLAAKLDVVALGFALLVNNPHVLAILVGHHRLVVDQQRIESSAAEQAHACKQTWGEHPVFVVQYGTHAHGAGIAVDLVVKKVDGTAMRKSIFAGQANLYGQPAVQLAATVTVARHFRVAQERAFIGVEIHV